MIWPDRPLIIQYGACALHVGYLRLQTYSECVNAYGFSTATEATGTRVNITFIVHYLSYLQHTLGVVGDSWNNDANAVKAQYACISSL